MVAQHPHCQAFHKVHMERFGYKLISSYLIIPHSYLFFVLLYGGIFFTVRQILIHPFKTACRDGNAAGTYKLERTQSSAVSALQDVVISSLIPFFSTMENTEFTSTIRALYLRMILDTSGFSSSMGSLSYTAQSHAGKFHREIVRLNHIYLFGDLLRHLIDTSYPSRL